MIKLMLFSYFFNRMLQDSYVYYPDLRPEPENYIKCSGTNEMREEVEALEKKFFLEEIALDVTDERCHLLDRNLRQGSIAIKRVLNIPIRKRNKLET